MRRRMVGRGTVAAALGLLWTPLGAAAGSHPTFSNPPEIASAAGVLTATLTVAPTQVQIGGRTVSGATYNGLYVPPVLRVQRGDVIELTLVNHLADATNLHYHGMLVSPLGSADDVFHHLQPTESYAYEVPIPADHPQGLFWYHPHQPPLTERQIDQGLAGAIVVEGILDPFPELAGITERIMVLKDVQQKHGVIPAEIDPGARSVRTINGLVNARIDIRPGETQFWRILNTGPDKYAKLHLDGYTFYEVARDGNRHTQLLPMKTLLVPPSSRSEVLVQGSRPGTHHLRAMSFDTGPEGDRYAGTVLATVVSAGAAETPVALPTSFPAVPDLRTVPIAQHRTFKFSNSDNPEGFLINDKQFDHDRVDTTVTLGDTEEWTLTNDSKEFHLFHIHQVDFQVTEVNGVAQPFVGRQDTVNIPFKTRKGMGTVKILIPFTNPLQVGKFVYHCHIGEHEDKGMMAVIQVVDPAAPAAVTR